MRDDFPSGGANLISEAATDGRLPLWSVEEREERERVTDLLEAIISAYQQLIWEADPATAAALEAEERPYVLAYATRASLTTDQRRRASRAYSAALEQMEVRLADERPTA